MDFARSWLIAELIWLKLLELKFQKQLGWNWHGTHGARLHRAH